MGIFGKKQKKFTLYVGLFDKNTKKYFIIFFLVPYNTFTICRRCDSIRRRGNI